MKDTDYSKAARMVLYGFGLIASSFVVHYRPSVWAYVIFAGFVHVMVGIAGAAKAEGIKVSDDFSIGAGMLLIAYLLGRMLLKNPTEFTETLIGFANLGLTFTLPTLIGLFFIGAVLLIARVIIHCVDSAVSVNKRGKP